MFVCVFALFHCALAVATSYLHCFLKSLQVVDCARLHVSDLRTLACTAGNMMNDWTFAHPVCVPVQLATQGMTLGPHIIKWHRTARLKGSSWLCARGCHGLAASLSEVLKQFDCAFMVTSLNVKGSGSSHTAKQNSTQQTENNLTHQNSTQREKFWCPSKATAPHNSHHLAI
jgi:hypothetical protein